LEAPAAAGLILQGDRMAAPQMQMPAHVILGTPLKTNFAPSSFFEDTAVRRLHIIKRTAPSLFQRFAQRRFLNDLNQQRTVVTRITTGV